MILIDTSAWIDFFRGSGRLCDQVDRALGLGDAALCGPVVTELRRGLRDKGERKRVLLLLDSCHWLSSPEDVWVEAGDLGFALARNGVVVKTLDLLIAVHALSHNIPLLTGDQDFARMADAGARLQLLP